MIPARDALERLREGNLRFASDVRGRGAVTSERRRIELAAGQEPFAIILGCSDSRVPAEIVFDQGLGDLFVIRVAGNIVAPFADRQRRVRRGTLRHAARRGPRAFAVRRGAGDARGLAEARDGHAFVESAFDRGSRAAFRRGLAGDGAPA